jgi:hypothetical protein
MWRIKVLIQFILAHCPGGERLNYLLQRLNKRHSAAVLGKRVISYAQRLNFINSHAPLQDSTVVEVGTGWDALTALLFYFAGTKKVYTYDHLPHVRFKVVQETINQIAIHRDQIMAILSIPKTTFIERLERLQGSTSLHGLFSRAGIHYQAPGDAAKTGLADKSVDLFYSYAVLEHVPEKVIELLTVESKRILKPTGLAYHAIGLHDHYISFDGSISKVNFLQYPEWLWRFFVKNNISYHNRLREKQFLNIFRFSGAHILLTRSETDPADVQLLKTMNVDKQFQGMTPEELAVHYSEVVLTFTAPTNQIQLEQNTSELTHDDSCLDQRAA